MATTNARSPTEEPEPLEDELELLEDELEPPADELELELEDEELLEDDELLEGSVALVSPPQPASATGANASIHQREDRFCFEFVMGVFQNCLLMIVVI